MLCDQTQAPGPLDVLDVTAHTPPPLFFFPVASVCMSDSTMYCRGAQS